MTRQDNLKVNPGTKNGVAYTYLTSSRPGGGIFCTDLGDWIGLVLLTIFVEESHGT